MVDSAHTMDVLSVVFFLVAGLWLIVALFYSVMVLCFLRARAAGLLGSIHDENYGRIHLCGNLYLPLGCLFRRYALHLNLEDAGPSRRTMTRSERRAAMERLLVEKRRTKSASNLKKERMRWRILNKKKESGSSKEAPTVTSSQSVEVLSDPPDSSIVPESIDDAVDLESGPFSEHGDNDADEESYPMCSICLDDDTDDTVFCPETCTHQFHANCILDWLQRHSNVGCPCCREPMVTEDEVLATVKAMRNDKKKARAATRKKPKSANVEDLSETDQNLDNDEEVFAS